LGNEEGDRLQLAGHRRRLPGLLHREGNQERVECLHPETGAKYWDFTYPTQFEDRYGYNNGPRASPVIDGDRVYTYGAEGKLHVLKLQTGQLYWKRDLAAEFKVPQDFFGTATTPLIEGDLLIINMGAPRGPTVAAFHKVTGKMVWGLAASGDPAMHRRCPATVNGKRRIFVFAGGESQPPTGGLLSIDPANGAVDFTFPWRSRSYESVNAASPVVAGNRVFVSASYRTGGALIDVLPSRKAQRRVDLAGDRHTLQHRDSQGRLPLRIRRTQRARCIARRCRLEDRQGGVAREPGVGGDLQRQRHAVAPDVGHLSRAASCGGRTLPRARRARHLLWLDLSPKGYKELARAWLFAARETWSLPVLSHGLLYISQHSRDVQTNVVSAAALLRPARELGDQFLRITSWIARTSSRPNAVRSAMLGSASAFR
jgi:hypothetical protein